MRGRLTPAAAASAAVATAAAVAAAAPPVAAQGEAWADRAALSTGTGAAYRGLLANAVSDRPAVAAPPVPRVATGYTPTPEAAAAARDGVIARLSRTNPDAARRLGTALAGHDAGAVYGRIVAPFGLRRGDVVDAMTAYTVLGWLIVSDAPDPSPRAVGAARAQLAGRAGAIPGIGDAQTRAAVGEELALLFVVLHSGWQSARRAGGQELADFRRGVAAYYRQRLDVDLAALALGDGGLARGGGGAAVAARDPGPAAEPGVAAPPPLPPPPSAGARRGAAAVEAVVLAGEYEYGVGGGAYFTYVPYVLYADGRVGAPAGPPVGEFDRDSAARARPGDWGRWRRQGTAITVTWDDGKTKQWNTQGDNRVFYARPGPRGQQLAGRFRALGGGGNSSLGATDVTSMGGAVTTFSMATFDFRPDGTFDLARAGGGGNAGISATARSETAGRYAIDGWTITLSYPGGRTERGFYYRYPDSERTIGIGGPKGVRTYVMRRE